MEQLTVKDLEFLIEELDGYEPKITQSPKKEALSSLHKAVTALNPISFIRDPANQIDSIDKELDGIIANLNKLNESKKDDAALIRAKLIIIRRGMQAAK